MNNRDHTAIIETIQAWARELGFQDIGFTGVNLHEHEAYLEKWLQAGYHGTMDWMDRHGSKRSRPSELVPGTCTVISCRMDYLPEAADAWEILENSEKGFVSRYALGRDYHKLIRSRLAKLAERIRDELACGTFRAFVDSAPVLERAVAEQSGLGWIAKNTMLINESAGSYFFLGEIYTDIPFMPSDPKEEKHCGSCSACMVACPTDAFVAPFVLDARRCISYLTIEHKGSIDEALRPKMGNRIYGCDDCQLVCPWNKFATTSPEPDFAPREGLDQADLVTLFAWTEKEFEERLQGSPIRRIGHERWLRNIAVALGNAETTQEIVNALRSKQDTSSPLVKEHIAWALTQHGC
ncbi:tRNA epoxyqueuosine(34) reductase QueG [Luminiphilus sp.]|nr:tRNA epoxyqueuosine(34) reductase QueG [Luminiphilus sp.]MDA8814077.1 tRNA epoxyqueuosine(34) reductase QueG [Luminiphilus sp.]MDB2653293.1 tRNA epoxyqueuosine(34) reductase QueG [Luminiphilus sp.]MDC3197390.1 tRNA epoxyqueuosine(34) reductase QueG [Luminiphilus sp.]